MERTEHSFEKNGCPILTVNDRLVAKYVAIYSNIDWSNSETTIVLKYLRKYTKLKDSNIS